MDHSSQPYSIQRIWIWSHKKYRFSRSFVFDEPVDTSFQEDESGLKYSRLANEICLYKGY
jgi:hypothetical protein